MNTKTFRISVFSTLSLAIGALTMNAASASTQDSSASRVTVRYADLDLSQPADAQVLYRRLQRAAASVCGTTTSGDLEAKSRWARCYRQALQQAVTQVHAPQLVVAYRSDVDHSAPRG